MQALEGDLIRLACLFIPSFELFRQSRIAYNHADKHLSMVVQSSKTGNLVQNQNDQKFGAVMVTPKEGSARKSFKYTYYSFEPEDIKNYQNLSGSLFYSKIDKTQIQRGTPGIKEDAVVDLKCFSINKSALVEEIKPLNPKNLWSDMLDSTTRKTLTERNLYSLNKIQLTLKLSPMAIFGEIKIDEIRNVTKIIPQYIASTFNEIIKYYQEIKEQKAPGIIIGGALLGAAVAVTYFLFRNEFSIMKNKIRTILRHQPVQADFLLSDPADKLHCRQCKTKYSNIALPCSHISICEDCYNIDHKCAICGVVSTTYTKVFI